jgi:hypothetical protein
MFASASPALFTHTKTPFEHFKDDIQRYCTSIGAGPLNLTDHELLQLEWLVANTFITPEARTQTTADPIPFEIKRAIARRFSFELLLKGDADSYQKFIAQQAEPKLTLEHFHEISVDAKTLEEDEKAVIRLSCLLTLTAKARTLLRDKSPSNDSEEFLTQLAGWLDTDDQVKSLFPIAHDLTSKQTRLLTKMYWPNTHLRHMLQTEGGDNMTASFKQGIKDGSFTIDDFAVLKWRWMTVAFGFAAGSGAKYYNADIHYLTQTVNTELEEILYLPHLTGTVLEHSFPNENSSFLDGYLLKRAEKAGLRNGHASLLEKYFFGHLAAFSNQVHILNDDLGTIVFDAYIKSQEEMLHQGIGGASLAAHYDRIRRNPDAVTPTYVTSVYSTAYDLLYNQRVQLGESPEDARDAALFESTQFICYVLVELYQCDPTRRISLQAVAQKPEVTPLLTAWQENHNSLDFDLNENLEMEVTIKRSAASNRMN